MPHIKTFLRYAGQRLAWTLLTSHNLSKAAWGRVQKKGKPDEHFQIDSYELGVRTRMSNNPCVCSRPARVDSGWIDSARPSFLPTTLREVSVREVEHLLQLHLLRSLTATRYTR